jgi:transcriptional regulator with XRE-family HTH domain
MKNYLKEKRCSSGMTQEQLARKSGLTQATISRIESGIPPSLYTVLLLSRVLAVPVEELFALDEDDLPRNLRL